MTDTQTILRHTLATIAYRLSKTLNSADLKFLRFQTFHGVRTPAEIIFHMASVLSFCRAAIENKTVEKPAAVEEAKETSRFFDLLQQTDIALQNHSVDLELALQLMQGPLADMLTHIGQIALLRRYYNQPVPAENFMLAKIKVGNISPEDQEA
ncbi:hypothetical protein [Adhaeribacter pallidiroseus]|uniref:DinB-like domain-containing protein n=1 Tax=Adhaeribacter pallidiroseus TaxID=2072847 RepID=A0A369QMC5_9BACT|nr:hypothetical protein [Adhaeribacter pallidiroseus]RDC65490.1 hypothetical protein AHMF7616_04120 [Adhaeribacter pallidiroseus]